MLIWLILTVCKLDFQLTQGRNDINSGVGSPRRAGPVYPQVFCKFISISLSFFLCVQCQVLKNELKFLSF